MKIGQTRTSPPQSRMTGLNNFNIASQKPFPSTASPANTVMYPGAFNANTNGDGTVPVRMERTNLYQGTGGQFGFRYALLNTGAGNNMYNAWSGTPTPSNNAGVASPYRFISNPFTVDSTQPGMSFGGSFVVNLQTPDGATTYQTFNVTFPAPVGGLVPIPDLSRYGPSFSGSAPFGFSSVGPDWWNFDNRLAWLTSYEAINQATTSPLQGRGTFIRSETLPATGTTWTYSGSTIANLPLPTFAKPQIYSDVVRTLVAKYGDYRRVMGKSVVNAAVTSSPTGAPPDFDKGPGYDAVATKLGHLFSDQTTAFGGAGRDLGGSLVPQPSAYSSWLTPKVPSAAQSSGLATATGTYSAADIWTQIQSPLGLG